MAIGDILFSLMGQPNPQAQLAKSMNNYVGQVGSDAGIVPGPDAGLAGPALAKAGGASAPGTMPNTAGAMQQPAPPPQAPPQPQAYQTPQDLGQIYLQLMQRQQANAQINMGLGLLAGAFSHNQADRSNMIGAMESLNQQQGGGIGGNIGQIAQLQQMAWQRQMLMAQMQHLPAIAKEMGISNEMATGLFMSGKLGDVMQSISQNKYMQGTPEYQANVNKAVADAGLTTAQTGAVPSNIAKTQAETGEAIARTGAIPTDVALKQAQTQAALAAIPKTAAEVEGIQATTQKTLQDVAMPTDQIKNYGFYAKGQLGAGIQPVSFGDWMASGGVNPTEQMKDYRFAMTQIPAGQPHPAFSDWVAEQAGKKEATTQTQMLQTQRLINAQGMLPDYTSEATRQIANIDAILNDPHLKDITGANAKRLLQYAPGTPQKALAERLDMLRGETGVQGLDKIKGGIGRVLGTEYTASTESVGRISDQGQDYETYKGALQDLRDKLVEDSRNIYSRAHTDIPQSFNDVLSGKKPVATKKVVRDPNTGQLVIQ